MIFVFVVFFASGVRYRESPFYAYIVGNYVKKYYMEIFGIHLWFFFYFNMLLGGWMDGWMKYFSFLSFLFIVQILRRSMGISF